ncbi:MAG: class I SAM-dependent methyltransferase [Anaerolineales bacterium]|nr:class I SAM-dependent methyltransferase [Anaerolineales bacterium]
MTGPKLINPQDLIHSLSIETLCTTAEAYYQAIVDPTPQMAKPFWSFLEGPLLLQHMGAVLSGLKLSKTMTVLDFGAGTCWLSRYLNQLQCQTISCDPSATALAIGKKLFADYPIIGDYVAEPRFLQFDGHTIDLPDQSVDRIVCFSAFHHIPNQAEVLAEFGRVLKEGGIAGFSEPGRYHSRQPQSQSEMRNFNVLENDIVLEEIFALAQPCGFTDLTYGLAANAQISLKQYLNLTQNRWRPRVNASLVAHLKETAVNQSIFFLHKGELALDSRSHVGLAHTIAVPHGRYTLTANEDLLLDLTITNSGASRWLVENVQDIGVVKVGTHLFDAQGELLELDFSRHLFDQPTLPGATVHKQITVTFPQPGSYKLAVDLVAERVCWFENVGAAPLELDITVI